MKFAVIIGLVTLSAIAGHAAGSDDPLPPVTTQTSTDCKDSEIFDPDTKTCLPSTDSRFDDETRFEAVRELAYHGDTDALAYTRALSVLATISDPAQSRAQTYFGFLKRKLGQSDQAMQHYANALDADPDNILARAYLGQAYLSLGDRPAAEHQLHEIRARGGDDSWPEHSLLSALSGGVLSEY